LYGLFPFTIVAQHRALRQTWWVFVKVRKSVGRPLPLAQGPIPSAPGDPAPDRWWSMNTRTPLRIWFCISLGGERGSGCSVPTSSSTEASIGPGHVHASLPRPFSARSDTLEPSCNRTMRATHQMRGVRGQLAASAAWRTPRRGGPAHRAGGGTSAGAHKRIVHDVYAPSWSGFLVVDKWKGVWYTAGSQRDPSPNTPGCAAGSEEG